MCVSRSLCEIFCGLDRRSKNQLKSPQSENTSEFAIGCLVSALWRTLYTVSASADASTFSIFLITDITVSILKVKHTETSEKPSAKWSGGGENMLSNAALAATDEGSSQYPVILKNVVPLSLLFSGNYIYMPQNAWAWHGPVENIKEFTRRNLLKMCSIAAMLRARRCIRIGPMIPKKANSWSQYLPNTLDESFELALDESLNLKGLNWLPDGDFFLVPGSFWSYRNHSLVIQAYSRYRESCENPVDMVIVGPSSQVRYVEKIRKACSKIEGISLVGRKVARSEVLFAMKAAQLCIFPSLVEASPVSVLEAAVLNAKCTASDISAHKFMCSYHKISNFSFFETPSALVTIMSGSHNKSSCPLDSPEARLKARVEWVSDFETARNLGCS